MRRSLFRYTLLGACLSAPFLLAGCSSDEGVPQIFPPLRYTYLAPISLNVSSIKTVVAYAPSQDGTNLDAESPEPPIQAVQQMLQDRLTAAGSNGTATVTINTASLNRVNDTVVGNVSVQVAVTSADGRRAGYTEASVTRTRTLPDDTSYDAMRAFLYTMTSDLVNAENVELEYQIRQHLAGWLVGGVSPIGGPAAPTPVEAEPLAGPGSPAVGAAPGTGAPMPLGAPTPLGEPTPASMPAPYPAPYPAPSYPPAVPSAGITPMPMTSPAGQPQPGYPQAIPRRATPRRATLRRATPKLALPRPLTPSRVTRNRASRSRMTPRPRCRAATWVCLREILCR